MMLAFIPNQHLVCDSWLGEQHLCILRLLFYKYL